MRGDGVMNQHRHTPGCRDGKHCRCIASLNFTLASRAHHSPEGARAGLRRPFSRNVMFHRRWRCAGIRIAIGARRRRLAISICRRDNAKRHMQRRSRRDSRSYGAAWLISLPHDGFGNIGTPFLLRPHSEPRRRHAATSYLYHYYDAGRAASILLEQPVNHPASRHSHNQSISVVTAEPVFAMGRGVDAYIYLGRLITQL